MCRDGQREVAGFLERDVEVVGRCAGENRALLVLPFTGDYLHCGVFELDGLQLLALVLLVLGLDHLELLPQVDPQLEPVRLLLKRRRNLRVHDPPARRHPLKIPRLDFPLMSLEILVEERPLQHVGDSLEPSVWVVGETGGEFHLEQVEHEEGVHLSQVLVADYPDHLGALALAHPLRFEDY